MQQLQDGYQRITQNHAHIRGIQYQLTKDNQKKSEETTKAAREVVKRLVAKAEEELNPTTEELSWLYMDLEREAKRNLVDKEMRVTMKMEERKERQTRKWRKKFNECWEREKYWKYAFDKRYASIWPSKKRKHAAESVTGTAYSPRGSNDQENSVGERIDDDLDLEDSIENTVEDGSVQFTDRESPEKLEQT